MKEKRVSIQVQRVIYVAEDGMEFTSEFMCKAHEAEMERDRLEDAVSALPRFEFTPEWADSDIVWKWYFISNKEELDAVRKVVFFDRDSAAYETSVMITRHGSPFLWTKKAVVTSLATLRKSAICSNLSRMTSWKKQTHKMGVFNAMMFPTGNFE